MATTRTPVRVAVIDDHQLFRKGIIDALTGWPVPHTVVEAKDGVEYEQRCREVGHIHLAVVDLRMPRRDGCETLRWMERHQPRTLGVAITYDPAPGLVRKALKCNAKAVLDKSVEPAELYRALSAVLNTGFYMNALVTRDLRREVEEEVSAHERWATLTPRQQQVLELFARPGVKGLAEVAERLGMSEATAETHRKNAYLKLGLHSKDELVRLMLTHDLRATPGGDPAP